jgi:hypothetical protein
MNLRPKQRNLNPLEDGFRKFQKKIIKNWETENWEKKETLTKIQK